MAGGLGNTAINDLLKLLFNNTNMANFGDATGIRGSSTAGSFYVSLHTADPGAGGSQTTSEAAYTSYARVAVARSSGGWTVTSQSVSPAATVTFPAGTGGGETITYAAIGRDVSGAGEILARCALATNLLTGNGVTPALGTGTTFTMA
jgi:hypothetical protein